jgi:ABC-type nitrate/sulfonate/bicarbonate transport system ATPase subunit
LAVSGNRRAAPFGWEQIVTVGVRERPTWELSPQGIGAQLTLTDVVKTYRRSGGEPFSALNHVSLTIEPGQFVCIVGPSGCGKSTLLQMVTGLGQPTSGALELDGKPITGPGPERGLVFQKDSVFPWMRVIDNVAYGLKVRGVAAGERKAIAERYLAEVGLAHVAEAWPKELSGGMLKRVAVATTFANAPQLLLMDEPFASVDYVTRQKLHRTVLDLWNEHKLSVMFVTHDVDEALTLADRVLVMRSGEIIDDRLVAAERPRTVEDLASAEMVEHKEVLLQHLGLGDEAPRTARGVAETGR